MYHSSYPCRRGTIVLLEASAAQKVPHKTLVGCKGVTVVETSRRALHGTHAPRPFFRSLPQKTVSSLEYPEPKT